MNCKYIADIKGMGMCDSEAGLVSDGQWTLFIGLGASEANISVSDLLKSAVFIK